MNQSIIFQRVESAVIFFTSIFFYVYLDFSLLLFALLLFVFDVFIIGYIFNAKIGAFIYNLGHSKIIPPILLALGYATDIRLLISLSLIWFAHIGLDRGLGYGLKLTSSFKDTHLGIINKK